MSGAERMHGFTLTEVMVVLAILGLAGVTALGVAAADMRASRSAALRIEAAAIGVEILSRLATYDLDEVRSLSLRGNMPFDRPMDHFRWSIETTDHDPDLGTLDVRLTVWWPGGSLPVHTRVGRITGDAPE